MFKSQATKAFNILCRAVIRAGRYNENTECGAEFEAYHVSGNNKDCPEREMSG